MINDNKVEGIINYISSVANENTRDFQIQLELPNSNKEILVGIPAEIHIALKPVNSFFIPSSVITLNDSGELGIKIIDDDKKVKFVVIDILSDNGKGYWIKNKNKMSELYLIKRGQEYVLDGELVNQTFLND